MSHLSFGWGHAHGPSISLFNYAQGMWLTELPSLQWYIGEKVVQMLYILCLLHRHHRRVQENYCNGRVVTHMSTNTFHGESFSDAPSDGASQPWGAIFRQILVVVALVSTIVINALANILPLNGQNTGELSDQFPVLFTPAGYVFSIWSLIYLGLIAYAIYQALPSRRFDPVLQRIAYPFIISSVANCAWIFAWHYNMVPLSLGIMLALLVTLIVIYARLYPHFPTASTVQRWLVHVPFRIYLGWITVATIVNVTVVLYDAGWGGFGLAPTTWFLVMSVVGTVVALFFSVGLRDMVYPLVIAWAYVGQYAKHGDMPTVQWMALSMAVLILLSLLVPLFIVPRHRRQRTQSFNASTNEAAA